MENRTRCRLCLKQNLDLIDIISLYDDQGVTIATHLIYLITKYLNLGITSNDLISSCICQDCSDHLNEFDKYCQFVQEQQETLKNEFLEIGCKELAHDSPLATLDIANDPLDPIASYREDLPLKVEIVKTEDEENDIENLSNHVENIEELDSNDIFSSGDEKPLIEIKKEKKMNKKKKKRKPPVSDDDTDFEMIDDDDKLKKLEAEEKNRELIANFMQLKCDLCGTEFNNFSHLRSHFTRTHYQPGYVKCCGIKIRRATDLVRHIDLHQNPEKYTCRICQKKFKSITSLELHLMRHGKKSDKVCEKCRRAFRSSKCLKNHLLKDSCAVELKCTQCEKSFTSKHRLRVHTSAVHDNFFPHVCEECGKKFKLKNSFDHHKLTYHQGIKEEPAQCKVCNNWLKSESSLRIHMYRHVMKEANCPHCERKFSTATILRRHISYMHRAPKNIPCTYCDKTFRFSKDLKEHLAVHTGINLYSCVHCCKEFRSSANMYSHIKRMHNAEWLKSKLERSHNPHIKKDA